MKKENINGRVHLIAGDGMKITNVDETDFYSEVYLGVNEMDDAYKEVTSEYADNKTKEVTDEESAGVAQGEQQV